jgi:hypothetical protein
VIPIHLVGLGFVQIPGLCDVKDATVEEMNELATVVNQYPHIL